ncbi:MAG TPA: DUF2304 domain-containing protein [Microbacteriaceae bacterium]|nr:DUF2304 domain-containing protein [Microbacteriaceae bacterium]
MDSQIGIKIVLIAVVVIVALAILWPGRGQRRVALRRIGSILLVLAAVAAIIFPQILSSIAELLGVGRGADLLLYATVLAFIGFVLMTRIEKRRHEAQLTLVARAQAIAAAERPWESRG